MLEDHDGESRRRGRVMQGATYLAGNDGRDRAQIFDESRKRPGRILLRSETEQ